MTKRIALFNYKGGINKTTTIFHLGWMLAQQGKTVILVDADPQCHLTSMALAYDNLALEHFYEQEPQRNIKASLRPAFEAIPVPIKPVECVASRWRAGLYLLPGHVQISEYETLLTLAQEPLNHSFLNVPGSLADMLEKTETLYQADYVLLDLNPSLSAFNQNLLMVSDYFIIPIDLDYYSALAIETLAWKLPKWLKWAMQIHQQLSLHDIAYPFPNPTVKLLGTIMHHAQLPEKSPTNGELLVIDSDRVHTSIMQKLIPSLAEHAMVLPKEQYQGYMIDDFCLASIPATAALHAIAQETQTPIFALTQEQLGTTTTYEQQQHYQEVFIDLAQKVIGLTATPSNVALTEAYAHSH
jgi:cellulose biosynthesis protein BcsQ